MTTLSAAAPARPLGPRIGVTLVVLALYQAGSWIALPGLDLAALGSVSSEVLGSALARLSLFALGVTPLLSIWLVVELAMILFPDVRANFASARQKSRLNQRVVLASLPLAALQAWGIAVGMESIDGLVPEPGPGFRFTLVMTLVTTTLLTAWFASIIERDGIGSGFWVMYAAPLVLSVARWVLLATMVGTEVLATLAPVALFAGAAIVAVVALARRDPRHVTNGQFIWPALIAPPVAGAALVPLWYLGVDPAAVGPATLPGSIIVAAVAAALVLIRTRSLPLEVRSSQEETLRLAALLAALIIGGGVTTRWSGAPVAADGAMMMTLTGIALAAVAAATNEPRASLSPDEPLDRSHEKL